jgi:hypothetical protein
LYEKNTKKFLEDSEVNKPVDHYRIGRVFEISFAINHLVLHVKGLSIRDK